VARKLGVKEGEGVVITDVKPGGPAAMQGLASGNVIIQVNKKPVKSVEEFLAAISAPTSEKGVLMLVRTPQGTRFAALPPPGEP
jgi:serine protease Do